MEYREKDCIEYALHIYDTFWDYYKKTLDERNQIINIWTLSEFLLPFLACLQITLKAI